MQFNRRRALTATVLALAASTAPLHQNAFAQATPATPPTTVPAAAPVATIDEAAKATLTQMIAAQKAVSSYSATITLTVQQGDKSQTSNGDIAYALPNKAAVHVTSGTNSIAIVSDGKNNFVVDNSPTKYVKSEAASGVGNIAATISQGHASVVGILPLFIGQPDPAKIILQSATTVVKAPDETLDGVAVDVVNTITSLPGGQSFTAIFAAGKEDHLLRRVVLTQGPSIKISEVYTNVKANPTLAADAFTFTPKPGMKETAAAPEPQMYDPRIKAGAMPLPFSGTDLAGKSQVLSAYKGKVVLLDFWATWCGPCRGEMPNVVAAYSKYHAKGFDIIGVSLDQAGDKAKLVSFTKENKMPWPQIYDGKYWQSALAQKYGVQAIPFSVLIGKDGKILAVNPRGEALEPAVQAALAK